MLNVDLYAADDEISPMLGNIGHNCTNAKGEHRMIFKCAFSHGIKLYKINNPQASFAFFPIVAAYNL